MLIDATIPQLELYKTSTVAKMLHLTILMPAREAHRAVIGCDHQYWTMDLQQTHHAFGLDRNRHTLSRGLLFSLSSWRDPVADVEVGKGRVPPLKPSAWLNHDVARNVSRVSAKMSANVTSLYLTSF